MQGAGNGRRDGGGGRKRGPVCPGRWLEAKPGGGARRLAEGAAGKGWGACPVEAARGLCQSCSKVPGPGSGPLVSSSESYLRSGRRLWVRTPPGRRRWHSS